jgi:hypothetical protein
MALAGLVLVVVAGIAMLVFGLQILVRAFKTSLGWGLASLFVPVAVLVFVFKHWAQARGPFLRVLACLPLYAAGFAMMALGGGATVRMSSLRGIGEPFAAAVKSPPSVETATLVLRTSTEVMTVADAAALEPCVEAQIGRTALAPGHVLVCARRTSVFGDTRVDWDQIVRSQDYFGDPVAGQWVSWLQVKSKDTGKELGFVIVDLLTAQDGRISLECDGGGQNREQTSARPARRGFEAACRSVGETLGVGQFLFNWDAQQPAVRFESREGAVIDLNLVKVS